MQQFLESAQIALQAVWANKLRSLLTVLGNIVAVTSIIAVVSLVQGLNSSVKDAIQSGIGVDTFTVSRVGIIRTDDEAQRAQGNPRITLADADAIRHNSPSVALVVGQANANAQLKFREATQDSVSIQGVTKEWIQLPTTNVEEGRVPTSAEFDAGRHVAVLGWDVADKLFGALDGVGKTVSINGVNFEVLGVAAKKGSIFGNSQDEYAVIPLDAFVRMYGSRQSLQLTVRPRDPSLVATALDETTVAMRVQRRLRPKQPDNFGILSSDTLLNIYNSATQGIFAVLIGVVSLSLVVGGIVIMNIMLMVVSERTREIGLRKSLGARRRDVLWQILTESVTLSTFGGMVGTGLGFIVAWGISKVSPLPAIIEPWSVVLGIGMTVGVGLFFGMYPASRAAALSPIEALRRE
jgi:putative ABC transport system permease protein